jgi:hypothetical protein
MWGLIWKIAKTKKAGAVAQVVEHLSSKPHPWIQTPVLPRMKKIKRIGASVTYDHCKYGIKPLLYLILNVYYLKPAFILLYCSILENAVYNKELTY